MNPILAFAIEHQAEARAIIVGRYGLRGADVDDIAQQVLVNLCQANPPIVSDPRAYWRSTLANTVMDYFRQRSHQRRSALPIRASILADGGQNPEEIIIQRETLHEVWDTATPSQRRAIDARLSGEQNSMRIRTAITRLKARLGRPIWNPDATCKSGHPWNAETTALTAQGQRYCRPCRKLRAQRSYQRQKLRERAAV